MVESVGRQMSMVKIEQGGVGVPDPCPWGRESVVAGGGVRAADALR